jgi:CxxC motif-containing protein
VKTREMVCISCPLGCRLAVREEAGAILVEGNKCSRGEQYAREEILAPKRVVTATVWIRGARSVRLPVKTSAPLARELIPGLLNEIYRWQLEAPVRLGQKLMEDIGGSGVDLQSTRSVDAAPRSVDTAPRSVDTAARTVGPEE